jgi:S-sulfo-L-cysteine synthase (3-phospho-L-serine-dependent)
MTPNEVHRGAALVAGWDARTFPAGATIAAIFPDGLQRYFDTIYNDDYCHRHHLLADAPPPEPGFIAHSGRRVVQSWTRCPQVVDPSQVVQ